MRRLTIVLPLVLLGLTVPVGAAGAALADEQDFKATALLRAISLQVVGDELLIEAEGQGRSKLLGSFTVTASLSQTLVPGCDPSVGEFTISPVVGTLELEAEALVCSTGVTGVWEVTGGSGEFAGASGGGTLTGSPSHSGEDPIVLHLEGSLSL